MEMTIKQALYCGNVLNKLLEQHSSYPVQTSFKLYKTINNLNEVSDFVINIMIKMFGDDIDFGNLKEEELSFYENLSNSKIKLNLETFTIDELCGDGNVKLDVKDMEPINFLLKTS